MSAAAAVSGAAWTSVLAALVFLVAFTALAVDRSRVKRRLAALERTEALLETDLADTRRELESLRECLRDRRGGADRVDVGRLGSVPPRETAPGDPTSAVG